MAKKKGSNRYYDEEFKQDVLRLVDEGRPIVEVAESLGLRPGLIYEWNRKRKREIGAVAYAASSGKELTPEAEIKGLKDELVSTKRERDRDLLSRSYRGAISTHSSHVLDIVWAIESIKRQSITKDRKIELISEMLGLHSGRPDVSRMIECALRLVLTRTGREYAPKTRAL